MPVMARSKYLVQVLLKCVFIDISISLKVCLYRCKLGKQIKWRIEVVRRRVLFVSAICEVLELMKSREIREGN